MPNRVSVDEKARANVMKELILLQNIAGGHEPISDLKSELKARERRAVEDRRRDSRKGA